MHREWRCGASFAHKMDTISFSLFASYAQEINTACVSMDERSICLLHCNDHCIGISIEMLMSPCA